MIFITGDTHGDFRRIETFCKSMGTTYDDVMIILGDAGINFSGGTYDEALKSYLLRIPITLFCIHGNHEMRPETLPGYKEIDWHGGKVYREIEYPNILFAKDGEIFDFDGKKTVVLGGAYSIDKEYRLTNGWPWFADEQPSDKIKAHAEKMFANVDWQVDCVLSHTVPYQFEPREVFIKGIDQSKVDKTTEIWLDTIEERLTYKHWYAGHFHTNLCKNKLTFLFDVIEEFGKNK